MINEEQTPRIHWFLFSVWRCSRWRSLLYWSWFCPLEWATPNLGPYPGGPNGPSDWTCVPGTHCRFCSPGDIHCSTCQPEAPNCVFCPPGINYCRPCPPREPDCLPCPPYETDCKRCPPGATGCLHQVQGGSTSGPTLAPDVTNNAPSPTVAIASDLLTFGENVCWEKSLNRNDDKMVSSKPELLIWVFRTILHIKVTQRYEVAWQNDVAES